MQDITIISASFEGAQIPAVNARDLHAFLGVKRDFTSWIKGRISQYGFVEGVDYLLTKTGEQSFITYSKKIFVESYSHL